MENGDERPRAPAGVAAGRLQPWELGIPPETLFEEAPCFITVQDRGLNVLHANRRFREIFGYRPGALCHQLYKGRDSICPDCPVLASFADGEGHLSEETLLTRDGRELSALVQTTPLRDDEGRVTAVMEMVTDITAQKQLQRKLHASRKLLRTLLDEVPCYITVQDRDFRLLETNRRFRDDFGEADGGRCYEVYKHRDEPCLRCPVAETFADGRTHTSEEVVQSLDGVQRHVLVQTAPLRGAEGAIDSVIEISTDITDIRRLQDQMTSLGLLVGSISHGVKGLLTGLDGGIYVLNSGFARDDVARVRQGWEMIQRNVGRIRSMVLDLLYYAKDREPSFAPTDPAALAADVCALQERRAAELGVELVCAAASDDRPFLADAAALHVMLTNLVQNALDACRLDPAARTHRVTVDCAGDGGHVRFTVADNGIGMDRETREKAFCLFFSAKGMEGTGLGLFIAHRIAVKHGGTIAVTSAPGQGAVFTAALPRGGPPTETGPP